MRRRYSRLDPRGYIELKPSTHLVSAPIAFSQLGNYIHPDAKLYLLKDWSRTTDPQRFIAIITAVKEDEDQRRPGVASGRDVLLEVGGRQLGVAVLRWISNYGGWNLFTCFAYPGFEDGPYNTRPGFLIAPTTLVDLPSISVPRSPRYSRTSYSMRDRLKRVAGKDWLETTMVFCDERSGIMKSCGRPQRLWKGMSLKLDGISEEEEEDQ